MRVIGYIRVSTEEQAESRAGLDAQREAIAREALIRGFEVVDVLEDAGYSASNLDRPALQEALRRLKAKEAEGLVVAKVDRLSRSLFDFSDLMRAAEKQKWSINLLDFGLDTSTPIGEMMANMLVIFAQFERDLISDRTKQGLAAKKAQGVHCGRPRTMPEEVRARLATLYNAGMNCTAIAEVLNDENVPTAHGGRQWWPATVRAALQAA